MSQQAEKTPPRPPSWTYEPLVACIDGPMVGQWFLQVDWDARIEAARYMLDLGQRRSPVLDYAASGTEPHPEWPTARGAAMHYAPGRKRA
jgi:hypothetical protein